MKSWYDEKKKCWRYKFEHHTLIYSPGLDQFFIPLETDNFLVRSIMKKEGFILVRCGGKGFAPIQFFKRVSELAGEPATETDWLDEIVQIGRKHLAETNFEGGPIKITIQ